MTTTQPARGRVIALRVVAATFVLIGLAVTNVSLLIPFVVWLPDQRLLAMGTAPSDLGFLVEGTAIMIGYIVVFLCFGLQVRRPAANVAALWIMIAYLGTQMVYDAVRRDIGGTEWYVVYALFVATVVLHPRRTAALGPIDPIAMAIAAIGAVPAVGYIVVELKQQLALPVSAQNDHFGMALKALVTVVAAAIAATSLPGRRIGVFAATAIPVTVATTSLAHPSVAFALPAAWAYAAIAWGIAVLAADLRRRVVSRPAPEPSAAAHQPV